MSGKIVVEAIKGTSLLIVDDGINRTIVDFGRYHVDDIGRAMSTYGLEDAAQAENSSAAANLVGLGAKPVADAFTAKDVYDLASLIGGPIDPMAINNGLRDAASTLAGLGVGMMSSPTSLTGFGAAIPPIVGYGVSQAITSAWAPGKSPESGRSGNPCLFDRGTHAAAPATFVHC